MADKDVVYVEDIKAMNTLRRSPSGTVGRFITRQTKEVDGFAHIYAPKPAGPGHGRTGISYAKGELQAGIKSSVSRTAQGELEGRVVAIPKHALYVHNGTRPHVIRPKRAKALRFFWAKKGHTVMFKHVHHPGTRADPFLAKALARVFRKI